MRPAQHVVVQPAGMTVDADLVYLDNAQWVVNDESRITGGQLTQSFPNCVAIASRTKWKCSGVLIDARTVLTAAHCVARGIDRQVFVGNDLHRPQDGLVVQVSSATVHPAYSLSHTAHDLAVLRLAKAVRGHVPDPVAAEVKQENVAVRAVGFGADTTDGQSGFGKKRYADLPLADRDPRYGIDVETEFVAGRPHLDRDSCPGDSGGPAYIQNDSGWSLAGITSRATPGTYASRECGDGGVYTLVYPYLDWIGSLQS